jgi:cation transport ATPase
VAGARVERGTLRAVVRWTGHDRAWARLIHDPLRRADLSSDLARQARRVATSGALGVAALSGLVALARGQNATLALVHAAAACASLSSGGLPRIVALHVFRCVHRLLTRGVWFRDPDALDRALGIDTVVFCARGTLQLGEPRVASIEPLAGVTTERLLSLVAGAYGGLPSPTGRTLRQAALAHGATPDAARSPTHHPGLGVTAVSANGAPLVVGARALLLGERVSVAAIEGRIGELEALGRSVVLVALDGRLIGLIALQDVICPGARAAVQGLLDARVEPVWLSGDSRATSEALARDLGIAHVRPGVAPAETGREIQRLARSGHRIAVIGRTPHDDVALGAGLLSINVGAFAGVLEHWDAEVASRDPRDAAAAIWLSRELRLKAQRAVLLVTVPALAGTLLLALGSPPWIAPLTGFAGAALAWRGLRRK